RNPTPHRDSQSVRARLLIHRIPSYFSERSAVQEWTAVAAPRPGAAALTISAEPSPLIIAQRFRGPGTPEICTPPAVHAATWGVHITFGMLNNGSAGSGGSRSNTSSAAPAIFPSASADRSAA